MIAVCALPAATQEFTWSIELDAVFDNREGNNDNTRAETIFFTKLKPEIGLNLNGSDRFGGGGVWIEPVGYDWNGRRFRPTLYYRHGGQHWSGSVGVFPRSQLMEQLPSFMWCDSLRIFKTTSAARSYNTAEGFRLPKCISTGASGRQKPAASRSASLPTGDGHPATAVSVQESSAL